MSPHILSALVLIATTGRFSAEDPQWFADRGPAGLVSQIRVSTLP